MTARMRVLPSADQLPAALVQLPQWVVWRRETRDGKPTKVLYQARQPSKRGSSTDSTTWAPFADAIYAAARDDTVAGVGFVFTREAGIVGVDLDHCRDHESGQLVPWAADIVRDLDSYTEWSPSETGVHVLVRGELPAGGRRKGDVEMYSEGRFFTITGLSLPGTPPDIAERAAQVAAVHAQHVAPLSLGSATGGETDRAARPAPSALGLGDADIIALALRAKNGEKARALYEWGDTSAYGGDQSRADLALVSLLAHYTQDAAQIDRLFRSSALRRRKWDERRGAQTYGEITIATALRSARAPAPAPTPTRVESNGAATVAQGHLSGNGAGVSSVDPTHAPDLEDEAPTPSVAPVLAPAAFTGLLGDIVRTIAPHTEAHPAGILVSLLVGVGAQLGRGPHQMIDGARHGTNLYAVLCGPSMDGRKGTAVSYTRRILRDIDVDFAKNIASGLTSGQGIIHHVRDGSDAKGERAADPGVTDKRLLILESEMGGALKQMQGRENTLSAVLRDAWDANTLRTLARTNAMTATDPHIALVGQITGEELRALVSDVDFTGGLLNRFLYVHVERTRFLPFGGDVPAATLAPLVEQLRYRLPSARGVGVVTFAPDGADWWRAHYAELSTGRPGRAGAATRRGAPMVRRLAMLYALCDGRSTMRAVDFAAALAVWQYSVASAALAFGGAHFSARATRLLDAIVAAGPDGADRQALRTAAGSNNLPAAAISDALDELRSAGVARSAAEPTAGRPREVWRHIRFALGQSAADPWEEWEGREQTSPPPAVASHSSPISHSSQAPIVTGETVPGTDAGGRVDVSWQPGDTRVTEEGSELTEAGKARLRAARLAQQDAA